MTLEDIVSQLTDRVCELPSKCSFKVPEEFCPCPLSFVLLSGLYPQPSYTGLLFVFLYRQGLIGLF